MCLGWVSRRPKSQLINFIILLCKYYLYTVRKDVNKVCILAFKWYVNYTQTIEKVIAKKNGRIQKHLSKWDPLRQLLLVAQTSGWSWPAVFLWGPGFSRPWCVCSLPAPMISNNNLQPGFFHHIAYGEGGGGGGLFWLTSSDWQPEL